MNSSLPTVRRAMLILPSTEQLKSTQLPNLIKIFYADDIYNTALQPMDMAISQNLKTTYRTKAVNYNP
jgi:hypothetical protein